MSRIINELQTPYDEPAIDAPGARGDVSGPRGGRPMPSGPSGEALVNSPFSESIVPIPGISETPNSMSGLPGRVDGSNMGSGDPGTDGNVGVPDLDQSNKGRTLA